MFPGHLDHFIRVHFTEEGGYQYRYDHSIDNETFIDREVGGILHNGQYSSFLLLTTSLRPVSNRFSTSWTPL